MLSPRFLKTAICASVGLLAIILSGCGGSSASGIASPIAEISSNTRASAQSTVTNGVTNRPAFLGAFFRPLGPPPYGIFKPESSGLAPIPYPTPNGTMIGSAGYCDQVAANGGSIGHSYIVEPVKLANLINLGARWTRMPVSQYQVDNSHVFGAGSYAFGTLDSAQCASLVYHNIKPVIGLEAGPVNYNAIAGKFSPTQMAQYQTAADFGQWCGVVAAHEKAVFPSVTQYSLPGNEVNSDPTMFPDGDAQIAAYSKACYTAVKAANPAAFVYGFELNTEASLNAAAFVSRQVALGCKVGTCYDGIAMHVNLRYPIPASTVPCYPHVGGDYSMQCVSDVQAAAGNPSLHVLISESEYTIPGSVPDEATKATATVAEFTAFAANSTIDGVSYANVDECGLYPTGYFFDGCLIDQSGNQLPAYGALQWMAGGHFL